MSERIYMEFFVPGGLKLLESPPKARTVLGETIPVQIFRALRIFGVMEGMREIAGKGANSIIYRGGRNLGLKIGNAISNKINSPLTNFNYYISSVVDNCKSLGIGLVSIKEGSIEEGLLLINVDECVSCAGITDIGEPVCHFESGMFAGIVENFTKQQVRCTEVKCWGKGDKECLFKLQF